MKTKTSTKTHLLRPALLCLIAAATLLLFLSCRKKSPESETSMNLSLQERKLIGKWSLVKCETYEVLGTDSTGRETFILIGTSTGDPSCRLEFKAPAGFLTARPTGSGSIGGCDSPPFTWKIGQSGSLELNDARFYNILCLSPDSVAFSYRYTKDILKLKTIACYRRRQ